MQAAQVARSLLQLIRLKPRQELVQRVPEARRRALDQHTRCIESNRLARRAHRQVRRQQLAAVEASRAEAGIEQRGS